MPLDWLLFLWEIVIADGSYMMMRKLDAIADLYMRNANAQWRVYITLL